MDTKNFPMEKKCAKCGKNFIVQPYHRFKTVGKKTKYFCTWTCYIHRDDKKEKKDEGTENN